MLSFFKKLFGALILALVAQSAWAPPFFRPPPPRPLHEKPFSDIYSRHTDIYSHLHDLSAKGVLSGHESSNPSQIPPELAEAASSLTSSDQRDLPLFLSANPQLAGWIKTEPKDVQNFVLRELIKKHKHDQLINRATVFFSEASYAEVQEVKRIRKQFLNAESLPFTESMLQSFSIPDSVKAETSEKPNNESSIPPQTNASPAKFPSSIPNEATKNSQKTHATGKSHYALSVAVAVDELPRYYEIKVPHFEFFGLEKKLLQRRFQKDAALSAETDAALFLSPDLPFPTHKLLPDIISARAFDHSGRFIDKHWSNLNRLKSWQPKPDKTTFFNLLPEDSDVLKAMKLQGKASRWAKARAKYADFAETHKLNVPNALSAKALLEELANGTTDTIVVSAHGDRSSIYFPDGSRLSVDDILNLPPPEREEPPVVILVSCNTGKASSAGINTIAQALLYRGRATAILAPTTQIPATMTSLSFLQSLFSQPDTPAFESFRNIRGPWQLYVNNEIFWFISRSITRG